MPLEKIIKISHNHKKKKRIQKAISSVTQEASQSTSFPASLTVEASLVFPIILFLLLAFMSFFRVLQTQQMMMEALAVASSRTVLEAAGDGQDSSKLYAAALKYFYMEYKAQGLSDKYILGGLFGISFHGTDTDGAYIDLFLNYRCKLPTGFFGTHDVPIVQRARMKKWNGFHGNGDADGEDEWVFITQNGIVYHKNRECTHLRLSISSVPVSGIAGTGYSPCEICGEPGGSYGLLYITEEGRRYHARLNCSGLKRTVYMIRMSQSGGRNSCQRCGG